MKLILILLTAILFATPAVTRAQKVTVDYDKSANFASYKTYKWSEGKGARNPIVNQMIIDAVDRELAAKGLTKTDANPDVRFSFFAAAGFDLQVAQPSWTNALSPVIYNGVNANGLMWDVTTGTLLLDAFDNRTDQMVWRGYAKGTLSQAPSANAAADAKKVEKVVKKAISKMFQKFPAGSAKNS
jgi:uncharacterized protein DUF4136